jgi:hypothetical protein
MDDYFEEMGAKLIKTISNGEKSVRIYQFADGSVSSSDGNFSSNINDESFEDALEEFEEGWREINLNTRDWADRYGCDDDEVQDFMDSDSYWTD